MNPEELISNVTIIAVGCDHYDHLKSLSKVREDLDRFKCVFCGSKYSVYKENQYQEVYNKTSSEFRKSIQNFLFKRSANQDILILFFSGHGTAIGRDDFGFCMKDAIVHPEENVILPTSVVKLSEILGTFRIKDVSPVLIVDSCYSGQISKAVKIPFLNLSSEMSSNLVASSGNLFGLITSCNDVEQTKDLGVITKALKDFCEQGTNPSSQYVLLGQLSDSFTINMDNLACVDTKSRVFIPSGRIANIPIAHNVQYFVPPDPVNIYSLIDSYFNILLVLWNDGNPLKLSPKEILEKTNSVSAYGNHSKLSLSPWNLVKDGENGKRELTQRGKDFVNGRLELPKTIIEDKNTRKCSVAPGSKYLKVVDQPDLFKKSAKVLFEFVK